MDAAVGVVAGGGLFGLVVAPLSELACTPSGSVVVSGLFGFRFIRYFGLVVSARWRGASRGV